MNAAAVVVRVGALVVAVGLVIGALLLRDGAAGDGGGGGDGVTAVACPRELTSLCSQAGPGLSWTTPTMDVLADELAPAVAGPALVPAAWADLVDDGRGRAGLPPLARSDVLASSPLLVVTFADRAEVLADTCGIDPVALGWACIGEHAGSPWADLGGDVRWGSVVVGHLPPDTATGLQATTGVVAARTGMPFSLADLRDVGFTSWFGRVERAVVDFTPPGGSHLAAMVTRGPSVANAATALEADLASRDLDTAFGPLVVSVPTPLLAVELVVVGTDSDAVDDVAGELEAAAFEAAGWRTGSAAPDGAPLVDLPAPTASPEGGVLTAVRSTWAAVAG